MRVKDKSEKLFNKIKENNVGIKTIRIVLPTFRISSVSEKRFNLQELMVGDQYKGSKKTRNSLRATRLCAAMML